MKEEKIGIFIIVSNNEMLIASKIFMLEDELAALGLKNFTISVIDNGSVDRTTDIATSAKARVIKYKEAKSLSHIMTFLKERVEREDNEIIVLQDGNSTVESVNVVEMIDTFLKTEKRSGMGYVTETTPEGGVEINSLIFRKSVIKEMSFKKTSIGREEDLLSFGRSLGLNIERKQVVKGDDIGSKSLLRIPLKSTWDLINMYKKTHPLRYYGGLSWVFLIFSLIPGIFLFGHWFKNSTLNYPSFLLTILLAGISLFSLSAGLIFNALNILSEKLRGMM